MQISTQTAWRTPPTGTALSLLGMVLAVEYAFFYDNIADRTETFTPQPANWHSVRDAR